MPKPPSCEAILLCSQVKQQNQVTFDLLKVVTGPMAAPMGQKLAARYVYLSLNDLHVEGAAKIVVDMVNLDMEIEDIEKSSAFRAELDLAAESLKSSPGYRSVLAMPVTPTFVKPGVHAVRVWWDGTLLANMSVTVIGK